MNYLFIFLFAFITSCAQFPTQKEKKIPYNRKDWPHWVDEDKDCQDTRQEILIERSLVGVSFDRKGCRVIKGKWNDYYYPEVHTIANRVDIDHLVPLKHAHEMAGYKWTREQRQRFANDPENLVITNRKYNRKKGAKTIAEWLPVHDEYACKYIKDWIKIKKKYQLSITKQEQHTIDTAHCP